MGVPDVVAATGVELETWLWLGDCTEVPKPKEDEEADVKVAREEMGMIKVVAGGTEELVAAD